MKVSTARRTLAIALVTLAMPLVASAPANATAIVSVGPFVVHRGFSVSLSDASCGSKSAKFSVVFYKFKTGVQLSHVYVGGKPSCKVAKNISSATLKANWAGLLNLNVKIHKVGAPIHAKRTPGCTGTPETMQYGQATGTINVEIHPGVFGKVKLRKAFALIQKFGTERCKGSSTAIALLGNFPGTTVSGTQIDKTNSHFVLIAHPGERLPGGVTGTMMANMFGTQSIFGAAADLSSAHVGSVAPLVTGSLNFTSSAACPRNPNARTGHFSGTLVIHDPLLGDINLNGPSALSAVLSKGSAICA
jgi:hypothetical protein